MAGKVEFVLDRRRGAGDGGIEIAGLDPVRESQVVAERGMDDGAPPGERCGGIGHGFERIVVDRHQIGRVFRRRAAFGHHRGDGLALPVRGIERHRRLGRGFVARPVRRDRDHRCADIGQVGAGHDPEDAGLPGRLFAVDAKDPRMGVGAPHEDDVQHPGQHDVVGVTAAPVREPPGADTGGGTTDRTAFENRLRQTLLRRTPSPPHPFSAAPLAVDRAHQATERAAPQPRPGRHWRGTPASP